MRDMLDRLRTISEDSVECDSDSSDSSPEEDDLSQQAVLFDRSPDMDPVLAEADSIRKEILLLSLEVQRLRQQNERFGTSVSRFSLLKRDSDAIARGIQSRGEALHGRIQALGQRADQLERENGAGRAVSRVARAQHDALALAFRDALGIYNLAEEKQRDRCKARIQRQASIMGASISEEQLDELAHRGGEGWSELSQSLQPGPGSLSCRSAFSKIRDRHAELVKLEARLTEVHELFLQLAVLVEEQGSLLDNIQAHVGRTDEYIGECNVTIKKALEYKKKNPFLSFCSCFSCCRNN